jgi:hypothetical protein
MGDVEIDQQANAVATQPHTGKQLLWNCFTLCSSVPSVVKKNVIEINQPPEVVPLAAEVEV